MTVSQTNRTVRLKSRPVGPATPDNFVIADEPLAEPGDGAFRVRITHVSIDPAMRGWMNEGASYVPPVELGAVMRSISAGIVDKSNNARFPEGCAVTGLFGVQSAAISDGTGAVRVDTGVAPLPRWLAGLGMPGQTAYFGLLDIGQPEPGETVAVSAASGAVGSVVGQIAKLKGCRVVGIAGGEEKCRTLTDELGFDVAVDYKAGNLRADLAAACPNGIDIYFENVGGEIFDTVLTLMNTFGRIPVCGAISAYNATTPPPGPQNLRAILVKRLRMQGFIVFDFADRYDEAVRDLVAWHSEGKVVLREDVRQTRIDDYPLVLNELFTGGNDGKLVMELV